MNAELLKDKSMAQVINDLKKNGVTDEQIKQWKRELWRDRAKRMADRRDTLAHWYKPNETVLYWKALGKRNFNVLKKLCRCYIDKECPACQILRLKNENKI